jgi:hypothetical protein
VATFNKFNSFVEAVAEGVHDLANDQLVVALTAAANAPTATDTQLSDLTEVTYTYCSTRNITTSSSSQTGGTYKLVLTDLVLTASGGTVGPLRYVVIYNDDATNDELIGWYDYGSEITLADTETLTIDFDPTNGVLQLA